MSNLFKLKKDGKTVGYLKIDKGVFINLLHMGYWEPYDGELSRGAFDIAHPFVCKDKNGKDVFVDDEVLVYRGKKNIGEGYVAFNERFLWWVVNNSNQDNDREAPQDWSQLTLCDVDIELIEAKEQ